MPEPTAMLTWENDVEATALRNQGWTISAIARHLGHDRKTIQDYPDGKRVYVGSRRRAQGSLTDCHYLEDIFESNKV